MAENEKSNGKKAPKRINKLTNARIKKEIEFLAPMFAGIDDEDKKSLESGLLPGKRRIEKRGAYNGNGQRFPKVCKGPPISHDL